MKKEIKTDGYYSLELETLAKVIAGKPIVEERGIYESLWERPKENDEDLGGKGGQ